MAAPTAYRAPPEVAVGKLMAIGSGSAPDSEVGASETWAEVCGSEAGAALLPVSPPQAASILSMRAAARARESVFFIFLELPFKMCLYCQAFPAAGDAGRQVNHWMAMMAARTTKPITSVKEPG